MFKDDYTLLAVLGASRFQLSFLVGGQLFIISSLVSFVAYLFSIPITSSYYYFLQYFFGKNVLPDIQFQMSLLGCVLTVLLISLLAFFSGCYYTFKGIKEKNTTKLKHILSIMIKGSLLCTLIMIWGALFYQIFQVFSRWLLFYLQEKSHPNKNEPPKQGRLVCLFSDYKPGA